MSAAAPATSDYSGTKPVVVIDNGTGFIKMGYAGNEEPSYIMPSCYADNVVAGKTTELLDDLDFSIGYDALRRPNANISYPIQHGIVEDWDKMERVWQHCIYKYLRVEPSEHGFLLTEPPANPPENREYLAEVMFETFGVKQLVIAVQGVLALHAAASSDKGRKLGLDQGTLTGTVIDSGDGVTHVIPIVEGYVLSHSIRHIPLAGRDVTNFVLDRLRERESGIPPDEALLMAQRVKEQYCYLAADMSQEFSDFDNDPSRFLVHEEISKKSGKPIKFEVGYEQFLGPEIFFRPEIFSSSHTTPLPQIVDTVILSAPIDCRKALYRSIVLSGGTTMFPQFGARLQRELRGIVDQRIQATLAATKDKSRKIDIQVNVVSHKRQRYAVWYGGSVVGASPNYHTIAHTKQQYDEEGPRICRNNAMLTTV